MKNPTAGLTREVKKYVIYKIKTQRRKDNNKII